MDPKAWWGCPILRDGTDHLSLVARGGIDKRFRMPDPSHHQLVNLVMISNIDWNDFTLSNDKFNSNPVLQVDRDAM